MVESSKVKSVTVGYFSALAPVVERLGKGSKYLQDKWLEINYL